MYYVAVVGGSASDRELLLKAEKTGFEIAKRGGVLICGGGSGVMEAAARGARNEGGMVIGILPGDDHRTGNKYLSAAIATGLGEARNAIITRTVDGVVAVNGEYGTLSEIALAIKMSKPVVGISTWRLKNPAFHEEEIIHIDNPDSAVTKLFELIKSNRLKEKW